LDASTIEFVPVRHEQAGAFMADVQGRLTGRASVSARSARERRTW
jgi:acetolactate synthase-1/2/3 large subunit